MERTHQYIVETPRCDVSTILYIMSRKDFPLNRRLAQILADYFLYFNLRESAPICGSKIINQNACFDL